MEAQKALVEYLDYLTVEKNRSQKTIANYERYLAAFFEERKIKSIGDITEESIRAFRASLARRNIKKITQSYYVIAIRNFLKFLIKRGVKSVPPEVVELPRVARRDIEVLNYHELERLLEAPMRLASSAKREVDILPALRDRAILEVFFSTGLRVSELCGLPRRIDTERGEVSVRGKGEKIRVVFLSDRARQALKKYLEKRTDPEEALFVSFSRAGKVIGQITPRTIERLVQKYAAAAGIPKRVHPHELRHSFATDLLVNGADLRSVQSLLGHANIATTQIYTHLTNKELRDIHKAFHGKRRD